MGHRPFAVLADHLTREGIAVLRYDDRGVGKSKGDFHTATHESFVSDALAAVDWLKERNDIRHNQIGLIGHSEGGIIGPMCAVARPDDIAFIVMLAGVGVPMGQLLLRQGKDISQAMGLPAEEVARNTDLQRKLFEMLSDEDRDTDIEEMQRLIKTRAEEQSAESDEKKDAAVRIDCT